MSPLQRRDSWKLEREKATGVGGRLQEKKRKPDSPGSPVNVKPFLYGGVSDNGVEQKPHTFLKRDSYFPFHSLHSQPHECMQCTLPRATCHSEQGATQPPCQVCVGEGGSSSLPSGLNVPGLLWPWNLGQARGDLHMNVRRRSRRC